ncbi:toll/interleukin-1 receptor domain-containing protein [Micromonospora sp. NRRL B-16802]|uniref:toll/interleukin-1 receptor domain-containing protein n=1 Tax=Micromonospora sp. NRRL B-16802 TaxID=1415541 RepID=UPI000AC10FBE|nr:toll/interleukin-1 receptor domain-containing protein [Micromonospora sp. NRRL B-16802]
MKVFISWSGEPSRSIASELHGWLRVVVQHVRPWMSDVEIESGTRWNDVIAANLESADFGLVCVTRSNQSAPWLMFESGALAKRLDVARLVPLCIDLEPAEVISPLQSFQSRKLDMDGMRRLIHELREMSDNPMPREPVDRLFEAMWPGLEEQVRLAATQHINAEGPRRSPDDMLAELVTRVRNLERDTETEKQSSGPSRRDLRMLDHAVMTLDDSVSRLSLLTNYIAEFAHSVNRLEQLRFSERELTTAQRVSVDRAETNQQREAEYEIGVGDLVSHPKFGKGEVIDIAGAGAGQRAQVNFESGQIMWLVLRHSRLAPLAPEIDLDSSDN